MSYEGNFIHLNTTSDINESQPTPHRRLLTSGIILNRKVIKKIKLKLKYQLKEFNLTLGTQHSINLK